MLEQLAKKDNYWRKVAYRICKDRFIADDIVQEMYINLADCKKEINDFYVTITMLNIYRAEYNKSKNIISLVGNEFSEEFNINEHIEENNKHEFKLKRYKEIVSDLKWYEKELLELSSDNSLREMEEQVKLNYQFIRRTLLKIKENGKT